MSEFLQKGAAALMLSSWSADLLAAIEDIKAEEKTKAGREALLRVEQAVSDLSAAFSGLPPDRFDATDDLVAAVKAFAEAPGAINITDQDAAKPRAGLAVKLMAAAGAFAAAVKASSAGDDAGTVDGSDETGQ